MEAYAALARLSAGYSPLEGRSPTYYSPVRHCTSVLLRLLVRLACVKRAASVRSEPGSNSHELDVLRIWIQGPPLQYTLPCSFAVTHSIQLSKNKTNRSRTLYKKNSEPVN